MTAGRLNFVEWLKAVGMALIVYGHTNGHSILNPTLPVNFKQVGVVFFLIATGYLLGNERRPSRDVLFNRLFDLYFYGSIIVLALSVSSYLQIGDLSESNYLPFALGANVVFNAFPANPSLWYIGTYVHLLIIWALVLRHIRITPTLIVVTMLAEVCIRAWLMDPSGDFIAYQLFTNWLSIFMLGLYFGRQRWGDRIDDSPVAKIGYPAMLVAFMAVWTAISVGLGITESNPFGRIPQSSPILELLVTSLSVSFIYFAWALLGFQVFRRFRAGAVVSFLGRNSMLCFMLHMPFIYAFSDDLLALLGGEAHPLFLLFLNLAIFYLGVCALSELLTRAISARAFREWLLRKLAMVRPNERHG